MSSFRMKPKSGPGGGKVHLRFLTLPSSFSSTPRSTVVSVTPVLSETSTTAGQVTREQSVTPVMPQA
jgi:hypothetical protein